MGYWSEARNQAGREFGARYWRWFLAARVARRVVPPLVILLGLAAAAGGVVWLYRAADPDWAAIGDRATGWAGDAGALVLWLAAAALAILVIGLFVAWVRRNGWRWWLLHRPLWTRRY
jgi:hypothetical protein